MRWAPWARARRRPLRVRPHPHHDDRNRLAVARAPAQGVSCDCAGVLRGSPPYRFTTTTTTLWPVTASRSGSRRSRTRRPCDIAAACRLAATAEGDRRVTFVRLPGRRRRDETTPTHDRWRIQMTYLYGQDHVRRYQQ